MYTIKLINFLQTFVEVDSEISLTIIAVSLFCLLQKNYSWSRKENEQASWLLSSAHSPTKLSECAEQGTNSAREDNSFILASRPLYMPDIAAWSKKLPSAV